MYESFIYKLSFLPGQILASYLLIYVQIPVLLYRKRIVLFILSFIFGIYLFPVLAHLAEDYLIAPILSLSPEFHPQHSVLEILSDPFLANYQIIAFLIPFITAAIKLVKQHLEELHEVNILEREKAVAELRALQAKIHPHFLFKTLDYLYTLSIQQSDMAPEIVIKLSDMLDYTLYQAQDQKVFLQKEIQLLDHYLDLQVAQYGDRFLYQFRQDLGVESLEIKPLLLLAMLESVLARWIPSEKQATSMDLFLATDPHRIQFRISVGTEEKVDWVNATDSLRKQLALTYPDHHLLDVSCLDNNYSLELTLAIDS